MIVRSGRRIRTGRLRGCAIRHCGFGVRRLHFDRVIIIVIAVSMVIRMMLVIMMLVIMLIIMRVFSSMFARMVLSVLFLSVNRLRALGRICSRLPDDFALDPFATAATARSAVTRTATIGTVLALFFGFAVRAL